MALVSDDAMRFDSQVRMRRFQLRCVLEAPIMVSKGQSITGELRLVAHARQSYDIHLRLTGKCVGFRSQKPRVIHKLLIAMNIVNNLCVCPSWPTAASPATST